LAIKISLLATCDHNYWMWNLRFTNASGLLVIRILILGTQLSIP
jgi:hypothetical protein